MWAAGNGGHAWLGCKFMGVRYHGHIGWVIHSSFGLADSKALSDGPFPNHAAYKRRRENTKKNP